MYANNLHFHIYSVLAQVKDRMPTRCHCIHGVITREHRLLVSTAVRQSEILAMKFAVPIAVVILLLLMTLGAPMDLGEQSVDCVPCDMLFPGLQPTGSGGRVQLIEMQLRGGTDIYVFCFDI